jgi:hypothetical protein
MLKLRKFLCWWFGAISLFFLFVSSLMVTGFQRFFLENGIGNHRSWTGEAPWQLILEAVIYPLIMLIFASPLLVTIFNGMAWWTVKHGKASGRGWAIGASLSTIFTGFLIVLPALFFGVGESAPPGVFTALLLVGGVVPAMGIAGLVAFGRCDSMLQPVYPAKPLRIAGDGTSRLLDGLSWLIAIAGYIWGMNCWYRWGEVRHLPVHFGFVPWLQIFAALLIVIVVHEAGHAVVGQLFGMKLRAFIVGPFQWRIRDGRWNFQFLPSKLLSAGGAASLVPTRPNQPPSHEVWMIAAGPLAGLLTGLIALAVALTATGSLYRQYWELLAMVSTLSLVTFAANLIPMCPEGTYSDGAQIYQLLRGGPWAELHRVFSIVASTLVTPVRPKDFDIQAIQRVSNSFPDGQQALRLRLVASYHFLDCGMIIEAGRALSEAEEIYHRSASEIPAEWHTDFVFGRAFLHRDAAGARLWWDRMEAKKPTHFGVDYWLAKSALYWIEGHKEETREAWEKGNLLAHELPSAGIYDFDRYHYTLLHQCIEEEAATLAN